MATRCEFSVEFFPPKNPAGEAKLRETIGALQALRPDYASVTYGAAGSTQERTLATVAMLARDTELEAVPHLTCIGSTEAGIRAILEHYRELGIRRIVALRGDLPPDREDPGFFHQALDLIAYIRAFGGFQIYAAAYPEFHPRAVHARADLEYLQRKVEAGASGLITQYFYNPDAYLQLRDDLARRGVDVPITVGVMPMTNYAQIANFSAQCGAEIPQFLRRRMESFADDPGAQAELAIEVASRQCRLLLDQGAPGLHFYTLNQAEATLAIARNLGL
ncbi:MULTISPECIES: methylenetetrahydrofolate reductase [NAD(P)H] [Acidithiobacillus]|jgi:methylenetetrahydrofolate reductase (NADPH)|uniref:Methylenetetrahydrofolate reductase n=3 Tax=Acidithiobacillus caldus TaxID=33059 RepID=A0A1E7YYA9_9PROT|nr:MULTISPECIES: methylenetetrahydrofolate reductase [NAD(P)H] [Acidithiobacillus]MBU2730902.1 methylenetetrahydrofolate reductase [NAD(P)H] [Acidithiobacillus caldus]MBU2734624.1 methylenetetrahydrofolate reductase [NAD(P)H] [Acidithiobacillus caldus ATCC 51756]MBU2779000.1 methylenetetrahydrofolate reductase [NAD(P)H] [Acidithiobacillus caldus]MBU2789622.1 methylenetetrahydrofolate reductase [NAD(P)H] [Acidithiobacillus caldus]MBU2803294.1 methylenetetrahydrofolate reductase [NAD(P)H] [Acidi